MIDRKLKLKIEKGTRSGKRLCDTCRHGVVIQGEAESEELIFCNSIDANVPIKVVECNNYDDKTVPALHEMRAIAWVLRTDKSGHQIGFVSPQKWRAERRAAGEYPEEDDY